MDFKDWRQSVTPPSSEKNVNTGGKFRGKRYRDYIEEQIQEAQERGLFNNLSSAGKPLQLDENPFAGEKALGYSLLKSNGLAPAEVELAKEIRQKLERLDEQRDALARRSRSLWRRRIDLTTSEKQAYNQTIEKALQEYERQLRELNSKILTLNLSTPPSMHRVPLNIEQLLERFREACPLL